MENNLEREKVTTTEAAKEFGVHRSTIHRWLNMGLLTPYRAPLRPRQTLVDMDEIEKLLRPVAADPPQR